MPASLAAVADAMVRMEMLRRGMSGAYYQVPRFLMVSHLERLIPDVSALCDAATDITVRTRCVALETRLSQDLFDDVPWAEKQMWAPDAAKKGDTYYLYFPAKDKQGAFRIGVATSKDPMGPFKAQPQPIKGSYSIDPAVFTDDDGQSYMYFGGIWGGQLQRNVDGVYDPDGSKTDLGQDDKPALAPRVAKMTGDMLQFAETPKAVQIVDEQGKPLLGGDHDRRFFEASWMHKYKGKYYFSYSTGDTHFLAYGIGDSPYGPFTYKGRILEPVEGWTTHHSIVEWNGKWWLFYADTQLSGQTRLRNVKVTELHYNPDGTIRTIDPFVTSAAKAPAAH